MSAGASVNVDIESSVPKAGEPMSIHLKFTDPSGQEISHVNYTITATQDGKNVLDVSAGHTHTGEDTQTTNDLTSADPVDIIVTLEGQGLPDTDSSTWTGPKGDAIKFNVVPEFGPISLIILGLSIAVILSVPVMGKKLNFILLILSQTLTGLNPKV